MPRMKCAKPQEWNIGAAISVRSRARSGIASSSAAAGSSDSGWRRLAPFGVPVVPLVRMTTRPRAGAATTSARSPVLDELVEPSGRSAAVAVVPGDEAQPPARRVGDELANSSS